jgi:GTP-binding protein
MKFIDSIAIIVRAGKGGNGIATFKTSKAKPKMGPDGGDGGKGGSVYLTGDNGVNTLSNLRFKGLYCAEDGVRGGANGCTGRCGEDFIITVPVGTSIYDADTRELLGEVLHEDDMVLVAKGGQKGLGNMHWATATHQRPEESRPGGKGEERNLQLELKLVADVGLAGFPNAGKSTLLSVISAAKPKIADYPFTTLVPNLGVVDAGANDGYNLKSFVMADVPGLIEFASEGKGLGHQFLKHLERTSLITYLIDIGDEERTPIEALNILKHELMAFSQELGSKPALVVLNKIDLVDAETVTLWTEAIEKLGHEVLTISAVTNKGLQALKYRLYDLIQDYKKKMALASDKTEEIADFLFDKKESNDFLGLN